MIVAKRRILKGKEKPKNCDFAMETKYVYCLTSEQWSSLIHFLKNRQGDIEIGFEDFGTLRSLLDLVKKRS